MARLCSGCYNDINQELKGLVTGYITLMAFSCDRISPEQCRVVKQYVERAIQELNHEYPEDET